MSLDIRAKRLIKILQTDLEELLQIYEFRFREATNRSDHELANERLSRWKARVVRQLYENVSTEEGKKFNKKGLPYVIYSDPFRNFKEEVEEYEAYLHALIETLEDHPEDVLEVVVPISNPPLIKIPPPEAKNEIFIIHGHDETNLLKLEKMLRERWNFEPIIMSGEPGKGRTLLEKFETEARRAVFAVALLTPDDVIMSKDRTYGQARPNVIFELGWFFGRLGRDRVCILFREGTSIHSDLDGISRIVFSDSVEEKIIDIENELLAAGLLKKSKLI